MRLVCALVVALMGCSAKKESSGEEKKALVPAAAPKEDVGSASPIDAAAAAAIAVTALDLIKDYKANDISADDKYRNRILLVTGEIGKVGTDALGQDDPSFVQFATSLGDVQANVGSSASSLKRGQKVTLRCTGGGFQLETPLLGECTIVRP